MVITSWDHWVCLNLGRKHPALGSWTHLTPTPLAGISLRDELLIILIGGAFKDTLPALRAALARHSDRIWAWQLRAWHPIADDASLRAAARLATLRTLDDIPVGVQNRAILTAVADWTALVGVDDGMRAKSRALDCLAGQPAFGAGTLGANIVWRDEPVTVVVACPGSIEAAAADRAALSIKGFFLTTSGAWTWASLAADCAVVTAASVAIIGAVEVLTVTSELPLIGTVCAVWTALPFSNVSKIVAHKTK